MIKSIEKKLDKKLIIFSIIAFFTLIAYSNSFTAPFTLDDFGSISNNDAIRHPWDIPAMWKFYSNRMVVYFTFSINYFIHQTEVVGYHIVNVIIHIVNSILAFLIMQRLLGHDYFKGKAISRYRNIVCLLSALAFATHPVQVNAVTYTVQRIASLAAMFYLLSVFYFLKFRLLGKLRYFAFTLLFTILAMFTKENTITIPFLLILIEFMFFIKDGKTSWKKRIAIILILLLTIPIIPSTNLFLGGYSQSDPDVSFKASTSMDRFQYFYTQMNVIVKYIKLLFIPYNQNFDYSNDFPMSKTIWENHSYISFTILCIIGIVAIASIRKNKLLSFGIFWFYIGLAVESSFISIKDVYFEHRLYFPILGFIMALAGIIFSGFRPGGRKYLFEKPVLFFISFMCITIAMNSALTLKRNYIFSNNIRLWSDVVSKAPASDRARCILATNYLNAYEDNGSKNMEYLDTAEKEFKKAIDMNYRNDTAHCNLAKVYLLKKDYEKCIEEGNITNSIRKSEYAYHNIGSAYEKMNQQDKAIDAYLSGYNVNKKSTFILKALGNAYEKKGDYKNSVFYFEEFLKYNDFSDNKDIRKKVGEMKKKMEKT